MSRFENLARRLLKQSVGGSIMSRSVCNGFLAVAFALLAATAHAQPPVSPAPGPLSVGALGGVATGGMHAGPSVGGTLTLETTDWLSVDGRGVFLREGHGASGLEVSATALFTLLSTSRVSPYVGIGGGVYRASFDLDDRAMFGDRNDMRVRLAPMDTSTTGMMANGSTWMGMSSGTSFTLDAMPMFYARRFDTIMIGGNGRWTSRSFTDPALTFAGGVRFDVSPRIYVRPDVRSLLVFGNGDRMMVTTAGVGVGVRF